MIRLSKADSEKIRKAVASAEGHTSGEIVPLIVRSCDSYAWVHAVGAILAWVLSVLVIETIPYVVAWFSPSVQVVILIQASALMTGLLVPWIPAVKRFLVSREYRELRVHRECMASFVEKGLVETRERTGVLFFIALFEKKVEILADRGIHSKVGPDYWKAQTDAIVRGIQEGRFVDALCEEIEKTGRRLTEYFPKKSDDVNELPDEVV